MRTCGAKTRAGKPCQRPPLVGRTRCKLHGGASLVGTANPSFRHGRYSTVLHGDLLARFEKSMTDPDLLALDHEVALVDALLAEHAAALVDPATTLPDRERAERAVRSLVDQRQRLVTTEIHRRVQMRLMAPVEEVVSTAAALLNVIREEVDDVTTYDRIAAAFGRVVGTRDGP